MIRKAGAGRVSGNKEFYYQLGRAATDSVFGESARRLQNGLAACTDDYNHMRPHQESPASHTG